MTMMVDPPGGWRYGFPKEVPDGVDNITQWCIDNGYPEAEVKALGAYFFVRMWEGSNGLSSNDLD